MHRKLHLRQPWHPPPVKDTCLASLFISFSAMQNIVINFRVKLNPQSYSQLISLYRTDTEMATKKNLQKHALAIG